jgi:hypothetical protein
LIVFEYYENYNHNNKLKKKNGGNLFFMPDRSF